MIKIQTNLASLIAQKNLKTSTNKLNQAIERMTTGYKINHGKDNAANYSISTNLTTKISAYKIAEDNASNSLNVIMTANDSLSLMEEYVTRLRNLAMQAQNGTYGQQSINAINKEANAIISELDRLQNNTEFNGIDLFNGGSINEPSTAGYDVSLMPTVQESGFIDDIEERDTSAMTKLSSISDSTTISGGTYSISSAEELAKLATMTNNGKITGGEFVLAEDIDLSAYSEDEGWTSIGNASNAFQGNFDGNGHTISNLYINRPSSSNQGLFGHANGTIKNVGIVNCNVTGKDFVGGLAGIGATITNSYVTGDVSGTEDFGGLAGHANSRTNIINSYATGNVSGTVNVGGLVGRLLLNCSVTYSFATGDVSGIENIGGLVGATQNNIYNSTTYGKVTGNTNLGVIAGMTMGSIEIQSCSYDGSRNLGLELTGTSLATLDNNSDLSTILQVGINSDESSRIITNTVFNLGELNAIRSGMQNSDLLKILDKILTKIGEKQVQLGATQNRLESVLEQVNVNYENLVSTCSTIRDADVAKESSVYIRNQILQQASATLLATANQSPAIALQLL